MADAIEQSKLELLSQKKGFFWEARTRILAWYALLMVCLVGLSIPIFTRLVIKQVDERVIEDLTEELESFQESVAKQNELDLTGERRSPQAPEGLPLELNSRACTPRSFHGGVTVTVPKTKAALIFDNYLNSQIPGDKTFLIATIDGEFYRASPSALPKELKKDSNLIKVLAQTTLPVTGSNIVSDPEAGDFLYNTEPLKINDNVVGVLIVASSADGEREEVFATVYIVIQVLVFFLFIALMLAWVIAGDVLRPMRTLTSAARSIGESDLTKRIPVRGKGEMADLAQTFNRMMERLEKAFQTQRNFINDAGHELRTPITIIRGHLELLEDDPEERKATIDLVLDELDRMTRFVEDLILLAKTEQREFLCLETIDLATFTQELYLKAQCLGDRHWKLEGQSKGTIMGDRHRLTQAIMNLAENATQHTTTKDTIALGTSIRNQYARLWVRDTGKGIKLKDQERIFQRFARASNTRRRSAGAGLGLAIVLAIAESHNGRVELYSLPGIGSTFTLVLPLKPT